jgi:hypothetical protein
MADIARLDPLSIAALTGPSVPLLAMSICT